MRRSRAETKQIIARAEFLRELLKEFGARLSGFDPGVSAWLPGREPYIGFSGSGYFGEQLSFSKLEWSWLEPLLMELRALRCAVRAAQGWTEDGASRARGENRSTRASRQSRENRTPRASRRE